MINWSDNLSVGVNEFDNQHIKLINMISELNEAMKKGKGKDVLGVIINNLISYTKNHFVNEETYFARHGYPEADLHKQAHDKFVEKVGDFRNQFEAGNLTLSISIMNFLSDWLKTHIQGTDKKYSLFFNSKGIT